jgi:Tfp pilus assembly PilM family ATPase
MSNPENLLPIKHSLHAVLEKHPHVLAVTAILADETKVVMTRDGELQYNRHADAAASESLRKHFNRKYGLDLK